MTPQDWPCPKCGRGHMVLKYRTMLPGHPLIDDVWECLGCAYQSRDLHR